jgi:DNA primase
MTNSNRNLMELARKFHANLPDPIRQYLNARGITHELIEKHLLGWNGWRITIPIFNREGELAFFKQAKDPEDKSDSPKMIAWPRGAAELYGWEHVKNKASQVIICEGEFDRLLLESNGFHAVTSTGGAKTFRQGWADELKSVADVYICFDNDEAGRIGALRIGRMIPHAKIVELPAEIGEGGDVTDFFARLGMTRDHFLKLMAEAKPAQAAPEPEPPRYSPRRRISDSTLTQRVDRIKSANPIEQVIGQYVQLKPSGTSLVALCPFHEERNPSFTVYPATGTFHCYGCGKHGDVITFIREMEHLSFRQALDALDNFQSKHGSPQ